jgi:hypothetical protein
METPKRPSYGDCNKIQRSLLKMTEAFVPVGTRMDPVIASRLKRPARASDLALDGVMGRVSLVVMNEAINKGTTFAYR